MVRTSHSKRKQPLRHFGKHLGKPTTSGGTRFTKQSVPTRKAAARRQAQELKELDLAKVRATIGSLRDRRVAPRTLSYYLQALTWLFTYFYTWHIAIPDDTATFDELVGEAIDFA